MLTQIIKYNLLVVKLEICYFTFQVSDQIIKIRN